MSVICMRMENDSISKAEHLPSFWNRGTEELENGLLEFPGGVTGGGGVGE